MPDTEIGIQFPTAGADLSSEFERQPPLTTPDAANVRAYDTLGERERGGSRPGLSKLIDATVNGASVIQHITVVVDPTLPGLNADSDVGDVPDPSTNNLKTRNFGRRFRAGGSGRQSNLNGPVLEGTGDILLVQGAFPNNPDPARTGDVVADFTSNPANNDYLVAFVATKAVALNPPDPPDSAVGVLVTNGGGTPYTQIGGYERVFYTFTTFPSPTQNFAGAVSIWALRATGSVDDKRVVVSSTAAAAVFGATTAYRNVNLGTPHFTPTFNSDNVATDVAVTDLSTGSIESLAAKTALVAFVFAITFNVNPPITPTSDFVNAFGGTALVYQKLNQTLSDNFTATVDPFFNVHTYVAAGLGLKRK